MSDFAAALLAGGHSRRMGTDKAFLSWQGRALWEYQLEKLRALSPSQLFLSCRPEQGFPTMPDVTHVHDEQENCGPLAGIAACLKASRATHLVILGVDLPQLPAKFLLHLVNVSMAECGTVVQREGWFEPLAAVYPRSLLPLANEHLIKGRLSLQDFIRAGITRGLLRSAILPSEASWFTNWNAPGDLP